MPVAALKTRGQNPNRCGAGGLYVRGPSPRLSRRCLRGVNSGGVNDSMRTLPSHQEDGEKETGSCVIHFGLDMDTERRRFAVQVMVSTGVLVSLPFFTMAASPPGDSLALLRMAYMFASPLIVLVCVVVVAVRVRRGVRTYGMSRMEAWWWMSVPYSIAVPMAAQVFHNKNTPPDPWIFFPIFLGFAAALSSAIWMLAAMYESIMLQPAFRGKNAAMIGGVLLAGVLWASVITQ
jgi:hypothetical protein